VLVGRGKLMLTISNRISNTSINRKTGRGMRHPAIPSSHRPHQQLPDKVQVERGLLNLHQTREQLQVAEAVTMAVEISTLSLPLPTFL
jgi:hypothetical protein